MSSRDPSVVDREDGSAEATPSAGTFGLTSSSKSRDRHLDRLAVVYVRQSTPERESRVSRTAICFGAVRAKSRLASRASCDYRRGSRPERQVNRQRSSTTD
jgi:hypothetical protein